MADICMDEKLLKKIKNDYPDLRFLSGRKFSFRPPRTIVIGPKEENSSLLLLHEIGHALCNHRSFTIDAERIKMERQAWEKAREIAPHYGVEFDDGVVESELDSYRDWLDKKSRCPACRLTRYQTPDGVYHCPFCENYK